MTYSYQARIRLIGAGIILVVLIFAAKLFFLQIVSGSNYNDLADRQYLRSARTFFDRGSIYFSDKNGNQVPAATLKQEFLLTINPQLIINTEASYGHLASVLPDLNSVEFSELANNKKRLYAEIASGLSKTEADKIKELNLKGVYVYKEKKRFYPAERLASHVLGFMAYKDENYTGIYGLEKEYNQILNHKEQGSFASFFAEIFLNFSTNSSLSNSAIEGDVILTIEPVVQHTVEEILAETIDKWQASSGGVIVMDPHTGEILAMTAWPDFHPGERQNNIEALPNPLVERVFELGSVIKPLTLAAALDAGVVNVNTTYVDTGSVTLNNRTIMNYDKQAHGTMTMQEVINKSLNTGAVFMMQQLGRERFRDYFLNHFGLGQKTGIDLPGEVTSLVSNLNNKQEVEFATASFGQGIALTPISAIRAFAVLANGGKLIEPYVVKTIEYDFGQNIEHSPKVLTTDQLSLKATEEITKVLIKAVDESLLGGTLSLPHYSVAAKTGTAQMPNSRGGYSETEFLHSFLGYYPAYNPRFVTFMYITNPKGARYSSDTLAYPFMETAEFLLNYYEVSPDREVVD